MRICITNVLSSSPVLMANRQTLAYRVRFMSDVVTGQALFVSSSIPADQMLGRQCFVETTYEHIEHVRIWTPPDAPSPQMAPRAHTDEYELVASVIAITPVTDNNSVIAVAVGDCRFAFAARELGCVTPRVGDVVSCTVQGLLLWDEGF